MAKQQHHAALETPPGPSTPASARLWLDACFIGCGACVIVLTNVSAPSHYSLYHSSQTRAARRSVLAGCMLVVCMVSCGSEAGATCRLQTCDSIVLPKRTRAIFATGTVRVRAATQQPGFLVPRACSRERTRPPIRTPAWLGGVTSCSVAHGDTVSQARR